MPARTGDRCADPDPSNGLSLYLDMAADAPAVELIDGATVNTDTGSIVSNGHAITLPSFVVAQQAPAPEIRVFVTKRLVLRNTVVSGARALAFIADDAIQVLGELNAVFGGVGATEDIVRCTAGDGTSGGIIGQGIGAGGAGYATRGGAGGGASGTIGSAGAAIDTDLQPLVGGCRGARAVGQGAGPIEGGTGGGAIQLFSRTSISIAVVDTSVGKISVGGGGGSTNDDTENAHYGGGGGGSGGGVLLEAPEVVLAGAGAIIAANGGGGGSGGCSIGGFNGTASTIPAKGGAGCSGGHYAAGGDGGTSRVIPGNGTPSGPDYGAGGGGGGGAGNLVVRNASGQFAPQDGAALSAVVKVLPLRRRARR